MLAVLKVIDAPEVLTIIDSMPELSQFLNSLYNCQYHEFFKVCDAAAWHVAYALTVSSALLTCNNEPCRNISTNCRQCSKVLPVH